MNNPRRILALRSPAFLSAGLLLLLVTLFAPPPHPLAQAPQSETPQPDASTPTLNMTARTVLVDVVVTGKDGKPVKGLHKEDFTVMEDGRPQQITSFDEHPGANPPPPLPPLPPNIFTNIPRPSSAGSPIVLLLDSLNTPLNDQTLVRQQILTYLQHLKPGIPTAIFTLGSQLSFLQGFTDDPSVLRAVAQNVHSGASPQMSQLLQSNAETTGQSVAVAQIASTAGHVPMAAALQQFQAEQTSSQDSTRTLLTLDALRQLARYLTGIPGRKSVIWFSGAFPSYIFPNQALTNPSGIERGFSVEERETDAVLATAQVAIYPIAAEGLVNNSLYDVGTQLVTGQTSTQSTSGAGAPGSNIPITQTSGQDMQQQSNTSLLNDETRRNADHTTMDQIADETGGKAFYNNNGIDNAIQRVADHSANYYTLSYTPSKPRANEHFRKIKVKLNNGHANLAYRDGYFAEDNTPVKALNPTIDPLRPYMQPEAPDSTEIPLALLIQPPSTPPIPATTSSATTCPSDNHDLTTPLPCYTAVFVIAARGLQFTTAPDASRHDTIEVTLVVYNDSGKFLNWVVRRVNLDMNAARFAQVQSNGVHFSLPIGIPPGGTTLRGGVYDPNTGSAGTLAVPLASITPPQR